MRCWWRAGWRYHGWWDDSQRDARDWSGDQIVAKKKKTYKERGVEALESLMYRLEIGDQDHKDIRALAEIICEVRENMLPSAMTGWLFLQRSGLSSSERAGALSSSDNSVDFKRIEKGLRD